MATRSIKLIMLYHENFNLALFVDFSAVNKALCMWIFANVFLCELITTKPIYFHCIVLAIIQSQIY